VRVLIVSADIGAGHDLPAALLAEALRERGAEVLVEDAVAAMPVLDALGRKGLETILLRYPWVYEIEYFFIGTFGPTRRALQLLGTILGGRGLRALVRRSRPDVIVSTYPGATEILGRLRAMRRMPVPLASAITDLAALDSWAHRAVDLHLIIHAESAAEVERIIGRREGIVHARGMVRPEYERPPSRAQARETLGIPPDEPLVVVSGGGWGVGEVETAARTVLAVEGTLCACLCGSNDELRARIGAEHAAEPRLRALGFTDQMVLWLAAADVLVHGTAGLTMLEAQLCGTHAVSFGWGIGHIRANNRAYERFGLAHVARTEHELAALLPRLLAAPRPVDLDYSALPASADAILALAGSR
jgi:UDP-N-acetylglucosamine:LPS N-acetylglucosamine transferase